MISHSIRAAALATGFAAAIACASLSAHAASFDGPWSVLVVTRTGPCDQAYRYGVTIARGQVYYAGGGPEYAIGTGRLSRSTGSGSWRGQGPSGACAGVWSATRG